MLHDRGGGFGVIGSLEMVSFRLFTKPCQMRITTGGYKHMYRLTTNWWRPIELVMDKLKTLNLMPVLTEL